MQKTMDHFPQPLTFKMDGKGYLGYVYEGKVTCLPTEILKFLKSRVASGRIQELINLSSLLEHLESYSLEIRIN